MPAKPLCSGLSPFIIAAAACGLGLTSGSADETGGAAAPVKAQAESAPAETPAKKPEERRPGNQKLKAEVHALRNQVKDLEAQLTALDNEWQMALRFQNTAGVPEGLAVLQSAVKGRPELMVNVDRVQLVRALDVAKPPMNNHGAELTVRDGSYAPEVLFSNQPHAMMLWGPYIPLAKGNYLVTYRARFEVDPAPEGICFLDVAHEAVTFSGRKATAVEMPANAWVELAVPLSVPTERPFEFRFWPNGRAVAVDRIYIYQLHGGPAQTYSVMGATKTSGTYPITEGLKMKDALDGKKAPHPGGNPQLCRLHRWVKGELLTENLNLSAGDGDRIVERGDILEIPEK